VTSAALVLGMLAAASSAPAVTSADLTRVGHLPSKGRVQDVPNPVVGSLISSGPSAISFLVNSLTDERVVNGAVIDLWPSVHVGDIALTILTDLFTPPDQSGSAVPDMDWDTLLERTNPNASAYDLLNGFIAAHGRGGLQAKVKRLLEPYRGRLTWDGHDRCFRPSATLPN
jgi:hypothetical protein